MAHATDDDAHEDPYAHPVTDDDDTPRMPWWACLAAFALVASCLAASEYGGGRFVAILAAAGLCRFLLACHLSRSEAGRTAAALVLAVIGTFCCGLAWIGLGMLGVIR